MTRPPTPPSKLYIAVRADLPPGLQMAQAVHAAFQFYDEWPCRVRNWLRRSNFLVVVSVPDEESLLALASEAALGEGLEVTRVVEPDLGDEHTAIAIQPGEQAQRLCASFPLALRNACDMTPEAAM
jgi:peptidyl-tRNA hydrolase